LTDSLGDAALVRRMLAGEERAFSEFFDGHFDRLFRFALRRLNGNEDTAEEVVQLALSREVRKLDTFRGDSSLFTWLCTFCRHEISAMMRSRRSAEQVDLSMAGEAAGGSDPDTSMIVQEILDELPPNYGHALEWKYIEGLSVTEIAGRLKVGPKAAESLLTRARIAFRDLFATRRHAS
jgi:RNA polymerase sigma-70 factor (ECF subfamily)